MTDLTNISQLSDKKNTAIVFFDSKSDNEASDEVEKELKPRKDIFKVDIQSEIGRNLKEAHAIEYIPSAIFIRNGKPSNPYMGTRAILENAK